MSDHRTRLGRRDILKGGALMLAAAAIPMGTARAFAQTTNAPLAGKTRKLGELEVSKIGLGTMNFTGTYAPTPPREDAIKIIRTAYDRGVTFFDTAQTYGVGLAEDIVGEALEPFRDKVVIATKFGYEIDFDTGTIGAQNSQPDYLKRSVELSLKRLRTDYVDLFYQHRIDPNVPIEDVAGAVQDLIKEGKVRHFGLSEPGAATIRRAHAVQPITSVSNEYAIWTRDPEAEVLPVLEELGIGFSPWSPTGPGYFAGNLTKDYQFSDNDLRILYNFARYTPEALEANWPLVELVKTVADRHGATPIQVAIAWHHGRKPFIVPIPGTTKLEHLEENLAAANVELTEEDMNEIEVGFARIGVVGDRMPEAIAELSDTGAVLGTSSIGGHGKSPLPANKS